VKSLLEGALVGGILAIGVIVYMVWDDRLILNRGDGDSFAELAPKSSSPAAAELPYHLHRSELLRPGVYEHVWIYRSREVCENRRMELASAHQDYALYCVAADSARLNGCTAQ
jgi:hypothetical protein